MFKIKFSLSGGVRCFQVSARWPNKRPFANMFTILTAQNHDDDFVQS